MCTFHMFPKGSDLSWITGIDTPREMWVTFALPKGVVSTGTDLVPWVATELGEDYRELTGTFQCVAARAIAKVGSSSGNLVFDLKYSLDGTTWVDVMTGLTIVALAHMGVSTTFATPYLEVPNAAMWRLDCTSAGTTTANEEIVVEVRGFMPE